MTPAQLDHLRAIDAHLAKLLDIAAKRTPGEWEVDQSTTWDQARGIHPQIVQRNAYLTADDAAFITSCSNNAEAGWKATRAAIASILNCPYCGGTGMIKGWVPTYADPDNASFAKEAEPCCEHAKDILAAFLLESLKA